VTCFPSISRALRVSSGNGLRPPLTSSLRKHSGQKPRARQRAWPGYGAIPCTVRAVTGQISGAAGKAAKYRTRPCRRQKSTRLSTSHRALASHRTAVSSSAPHPAAASSSPALDRGEDDQGEDRYPGQESHWVLAAWVSRETWAVAGVRVVTGRHCWRQVCCPCAGRRRDRFQGGRCRAGCPARVSRRLR
jgi:hypothetical protein